MKSATTTWFFVRSIHLNADWADQADETGSEFSQIRLIRSIRPIRVQKDRCETSLLTQPIYTR